jgi:hypothetical protein
LIFKLDRLGHSIALGAKEMQRAGLPLAANFRFMATDRAALKARRLAVSHSDDRCLRDPRTHGLAAKSDRSRVAPVLDC